MELLDTLYYALFFLIAIVILVAFHEAGHFFVARLAGVHVVRFCIGFGKRLFSWKDRHGTEFAVAAVPIGGYVRMLDWRDPDAASVAPSDPARQQCSFDRLRPPARIAIAAAGPAANFVLAFLLYWLAAVVGTAAPAPIVGSVAEGSAAHRAGLRGGEEIVAVDGEATQTWMDVGLALAGRLGDSGTIEIDAIDGAGGAARERYRLRIDDWLDGADDPDTLAALGIGIERLAVIGAVLDGEPAQRDGLLPGDRITHADGVPLLRWDDFAARIRERPEQRMALTVERDGARRELAVTPRRAEDEDGGVYGVIGAVAGRATRLVRHGPLEAVPQAGEETLSNIGLTVSLLGKMATLTVSPNNISGPLTIAVVAGDSARAGIGHFLALLALLSISLGILNLLPIPVLDGGQIVLHAIEWLRRRPPSPQFEAIASRIGFAAVGAIMLLAFYNDFVRWF